MAGSDPPRVDRSAEAAAPAARGRRRSARGCRVTTGWPARLELRYRRDGARTVAHERHSGPLRVLRALYPEGPGVCHHVVVHPPGGVVGGDSLAIDAVLAPATHAVVTMPGATRLYRSDGRRARQSVRLVLADAARIEWLPQETIAHPGVDAELSLRFELAAGAEMLGWDLLALGLPASRQPFERGRLGTTIDWPGVWLESARIDGGDRALLDGALGFDGQPVLATAWFAAGRALAATRRERLLDAARACVADDALAARAGVTQLGPGLVVLRLLAARVEPAFALLAAVRAAWRREAWGLKPQPPRVWST